MDRSTDITLQFQSTRLVLHVVSQPDQIDPLHHLAQLQVDHHQDHPLVLPHHIPLHVLLRPARVHGQEDDGGVVRHKCVIVASQMRHCCVTNVSLLRHKCVIVASQMRHCCVRDQCD